MDHSGTNENDDYPCMGQRNEFKNPRNFLSGRYGPGYCRLLLKTSLLSSPALKRTENRGLAICYIFRGRRLPRSTKLECVFT